MVLLLCSPRKQIHNSPSPRFGTPGGTIREYGPRAVKEVTFSVTVQTAAYLFENSGKSLLHMTREQPRGRRQWQQERQKSN